MIEIVDKDNGKQLIDEERHAEKIIKMYKCDSCSYSNKNGGTLSHHKKIHNPDNIPCDVCSKVFISNGYMQAHKSDVHNAVKVACNICSKMIKETGLESHKKKHEGLLHICSLCSKSYMDQGSLSHHKKRIHFPDDVKCSRCSRIFNEKSVMRTHWKAVHENIKNFSCEHCQKAFRLNCQLKSHISYVHSGIRSISCDQCPKRFVTQSKQHQHSKYAHNAQKVMLPCRQCEKTYKTGKSLNDHMIRVHSKELNFPCKYCGKGFKVERVLKRHMNVLHEQVSTPTPCNICGKIFLDPAYQKVHAKAHIASAMVKCEKCPKMFKPSGLASHAKSHELPLITCDICDNKFRRRSDLTDHHKRVHTAQEKPHQCGMCKKNFRTPKIFQEHQLTHTTEKPYKCSFQNCSNSYNNSGSRFKHMANHHDSNLKL